MVSRHFIYKQAMLEEAERLVHAGVLSEKEESSTRFEELHDVVRTNRLDNQLIEQRKDKFTSYKPLTRPGCPTSDGKIVTGTDERLGVPADALVGLPVSAGTIEGRPASSDVGEADLEAGDILITVYTDPLDATYLGGHRPGDGSRRLMTHGAVIAGGTAYRPS